jgi:fructose-bisphosphate aldolase class I
MTTANELETTIADILRKGRGGILAADESTGTIAKRFASIQTENTEENRRAYREMLFTTKGASDYVSGVILYEETLGQKTKDGKPFSALLAEQKVVPGIKVDTGTVDLPFTKGEKITQGLDGLGERLKGYKQKGARFAKWRAVITIGDGQPTAPCIETNAHALARYAALCQENGIVPIVEPEVLMDADNTAERCFDVTSWTLHEVFDQLHRQRVVLEHMLLKPNMVVSGKKCPTQAPIKQVAELTLRCFRQHVPAAVPGIVFLSGGQSDELATAHLDAMNRMGPHPWVLSYSYGRALQAPALKAWSGKSGNLAAGQQAYFHRAKMNGLAVQGKYEAAMEKELAKV